MMTSKSSQTMPLALGHNTPKELEAKRVNNKEANRLRIQERFYTQAHQHSERIVNKKMRGLRDSLDLLQSSTGSLSAFASYQDARMPLFMYGQRIESRKYSKRMSLLRFFHQQKRQPDVDGTVEYHRHGQTVDNRTADEIFDSILRKVERDIDEISEHRTVGWNDPLERTESQKTPHPKPSSAVTVSQQRCTTPSKKTAAISRPKTAPSSTSRTTASSSYDELRRKVDAMLQETDGPQKGSHPPKRNFSTGSRWTMMTEAEVQRRSAPVRASTWSAKSRLSSTPRSPQLSGQSGHSHQSAAGRFTKLEETLLPVEAFIHSDVADPLLPYQPAQKNRWVQNRPSIFAPTFSSRQHSLSSVMISSSKRNKLSN